MISYSKFESVQYHIRIQMNRARPSVPRPQSLNVQCADFCFELLWVIHVFQMPEIQWKIAHSRRSKYYTIYAGIWFPRICFHFFFLVDLRISAQINFPLMRTSIATTSRSVHSSHTHTSFHFNNLIGWDFRETIIPGLIKMREIDG